MADVSVPRSELSAPASLEAAAGQVAAAVPASVREIMDVLSANGHAAYVVGGSVRDSILGRPVADWDLATDALPERVLALVPVAAYENRFGTVGIRRDDGTHEVTTFRRDHEYADHRRPHRVEFTSDLAEDLGRRDFTINALAWGRPTTAAAPSLVDLHGGLDDLASRRLRAVGEAAERFDEDALRMIRAVRLASSLDFEIEPATLEAIRLHARHAEHLSGERVATELERILAEPTPSVGLGLLQQTGLLAVVLPELEAQVGVPQNKVPGEDLWDHTLRTVDAAPAERPVVRLAALLHDVGKPATLADGHFHGHDEVGARIAAEVLERLHLPRATTDRVASLVARHMFTYESTWSDAAVRRFIRTIGPAAIEELFLLRAADDAGSGLSSADTGLEELRRRTEEQLGGQGAVRAGRSGRRR